MLNIRRFMLKATLSLFLVKNAYYAFFMLQRVCKMICSAVLNYFWILWSELEEKRRLYYKMCLIERQNDFCTKNANKRFFIQNQRILDRCAFAHCKSGIKRSTATRYKEKSHPKIFLTLKILFFIKSTKNICFYPNHRMLNSYTFVSFRIKIKSLDSTINKRKNFCIPYTARKNDIFIKKSQKYRFFLT